MRRVLLEGEGGWMLSGAGRRGGPWRRVGGVVAAAGLILAAGWFSWFVQAAGDAPRPAAERRYEFGAMAELPVDAAGHFVPAANAGVATRRQPDPALVPVLDRVRVEVEGGVLRVALSADGALCSTGTSGDAACAGGARRGGCPKDADCPAGDAILAAGADVVVTDWSVEHPELNPSFEKAAWRVRIWRIAVAGPRPLIELDLPARPVEAWVSPAGGVVELVVGGDVGGPWWIVRCVLGEVCTRGGPLDARPTIRSAMAATLSSAEVAGVPWPEAVGVELRACQVLWPPAVEVRGQITLAGPLTAPLETGPVQLTIVRPDGEVPTRILLAVSIEAAGAFSFVVENPDLGYIAEPDALDRLLSQGSCQLHHLQPDGQPVALSAPVPFS